MGGIFSKSEDDNNIFDSPKKLYDDASGILDSDDDFLENIDPRSPSTNISRTPIDVSSYKFPSKCFSFYNFFFSQDKMIRGIQREPITVKYNLTGEFETPPYKMQLLNGQLKNKLLRTLGCDLNDPRSPSQMINRTPITLNQLEKDNRGNEFEVNIEKETSVPSVEFQEIGNESSFESRLSSMCEEFVKDLSSVGTTGTEEDESTKTDDKATNKPEYLETNFDAIVPEQDDGTPKIDPRSPSFGIERTPLVFHEGLNANKVEVDKDISELITNVISDIKVYTKKKNDEKVVNEKNQIVFEETESLKYSTPKKQSAFSNSSGNRTPLSCLGNKKPVNGGVKNPLLMHASLKKTKIPLGPMLVCQQNDENTPVDSGSAVILRGKSKIPIGPKRLSLTNSK